MGYALIEDGVLSGASKVKELVGVLTKRYAEADVTGPADTDGAHVTGRATFQLQAQGVYESGPGVYDLPTGSAGAALTVAGSPFFRCSRVQVQRLQVVENTTGAEDAFNASVFTPGKPRYSGVMTGWLNDAGVVFKTITGTTHSAIATLTLPLDASRQITGTAKIRTMTPTLEGPKGGAVLTRLAFMYSNADVVATNTPLASGSYTATIDLAQGTSWAATCVMSRVMCDIDYTNAVRTLVQIDGMFSGVINPTP